jgi:hypothetical protein
MVEMTTHLSCSSPRGLSLISLYRILTLLKDECSVSARFIGLVYVSLAEQETSKLDIQGD